MNRRAFLGLLGMAPVASCVPLSPVAAEAPVIISQLTAAAREERIRAQTFDAAMRALEASEQVNARSLGDAARDAVRRMQFPARCPDAVLQFPAASPRLHLDGLSPDQKEPSQCERQS